MYLREHAVQQEFWLGLLNMVPSPCRQQEAVFQLLQQLVVALQLARSHYRIL